MLPEERKRVIEALLFATSSPLTVKEIKEVLGKEAAEEEIQTLVRALAEEYDREGRSFWVAEIAGGYQVQTRTEYASWLKKLFASHQTGHFSRPGLETLAIVAYRQPVTRQEIESIRGVNVDGVLAGLLEKRLIRIVGRKEVPGRPMIYGTTKEFLECFGLKSLAELPRLEEFELAAAAAAEVKPDE